MTYLTRPDSVRMTETRARVIGARPHINVNTLLVHLTDATEGCRDLDVAIGHFLGEIPVCDPTEKFGWMHIGGGYFVSQDPDGGPHLRRKILPEWSSSVDAALSVMSRLPADYCFTLTKNDDGSCSAVVGRRCELVTSNTSWGGSAPTPALALMLAIVRALRAQP